MYEIYEIYGIRDRAAAVINVYGATITTLLSQNPHKNTRKAPLFCGAPFIHSFIHSFIYSFIHSEQYSASIFLVHSIPSVIFFFSSYHIEASLHPSPASVCIKREL